MNLRPYQLQARDEVCEQLQNGSKATLIVLPTGTGKTVVASHIVKSFLPRGRVMWLAHREELLSQASTALEAITGVSTSLEMADAWSSEGGMWSSEIVVSTVQTQNAGSKRMLRFDPMQFSLLVFDEAHHCTADSYVACLDHYRQNPNLRVLGMTATPDRADEEALGRVFDSVAYEYGIVDAIHDGWLVPIEQHFVHVDSLDFSAIKTTAGDLNGGELSEVMEREENLHRIAAPSFDIMKGRKSLVFAVSVAQADKLCEIYNRHEDGCAFIITGKTPKDERRDLLDRYRRNQLRIMVNVGVACLDDQTEILTSDGWVGCNRISEEFEVACWDNGLIRFAKPLAVEVRARRRDERMVCLETKNRSIRVTEDHRMLYRTMVGGKFKVDRAGEMVGKKCELPISGIANPRHQHVETKVKWTTSKRLAANTYALRSGGMSDSDARREALRRITERTAMRHKQPCELSLNECRWIGFWVGDGTKSRLLSGGIEYVVAGSDQWPAIAEWFEELSERCGFDFRKRRVAPTKPGRKPLTRWSFCRGTGFGPQKRRGLFPIEPYLHKAGSELWWSFDTKQFDAFLDGLWCADGDHGQGVVRPGSARIYGSNRALLDTIQAIAVCRGYRSNIQWKPNHGHVLGCLSLSKRSSHACTKFRLQYENGWRPETVWCVKSETGFIVTRRRGTVTVTGNTEGFDMPDVEVVVCARPTKSRSLYAQMIGRGTRPLAGLVDPLPDAESRREAIRTSRKPSVVVLDFVGNSGRHKLIHAADILGSAFTDDVVERAEKILAAGEEHDVDAALRQAENEKRREAELERERAEVVKKKAVKGKATYKTSTVDPFDVFELTPHRESGWYSGQPPTDEQRTKLEKFGITVDAKMTRTAAGQVLQECWSRIRNRKCTYKQAKLLKRYGYPGDVGFQEASKLIDGVVKNGWKRPS